MTPGYSAHFDDLVEDGSISFDERDGFAWADPSGLYDAAARHDGSAE